MFIIVGILLFFPLLIFPACFGANQRYSAKKKAPFPSDAAGKGAMFRIFSLTARSGAGSSVSVGSLRAFPASRAGIKGLL